MYYTIDEAGIRLNIQSAAEAASLSNLGKLFRDDIYLSVRKNIKLWKFFTRLLQERNKSSNRDEKLKIQIQIFVIFEDDAMKFSSIQGRA